MYATSKKFGTVLGEASALLSCINGRRRPEDAAELYEGLGIVFLDPGDADSIDTAPADLPEELHADGYCERLVKLFYARNPFY